MVKFNLPKNIDKHTPYKQCEIAIQCLNIYEKQLKKELEDVQITKLEIMKELCTEENNGSNY